MSYYLLFYDVVDDFVERRAPIRADHLARVRDAHQRGDLVQAGSFGEPVDGAALVFRADDASTAESFAANDPYVTEGLVRHWRVCKWHEVLTAE
jgi:uncharacterized protein YciI